MVVVVPVSVSILFLIWSSSVLIIGGRVIWIWVWLVVVGGSV